MADIKPYVVRYKAGTDKTIQPGIHGRFETLAQAKLQMQKCSLWFGGGKLNADGAMIGRAIVAIVVDQVELAKVKEIDLEPDPLAKIEAPEPDMTTLQRLMAENAALKRKLEAAGEHVDEEEDIDAELQEA